MFLFQAAKIGGMAATDDGRAFSGVAKELCEELKSVQNVPRVCLELINELCVLHMRTTEDLVKATKRSEKAESVTSGEKKTSWATKNDHALVIAGIAEAPHGKPLEERLLNDKTAVTSVLETGLGLECNVIDVKRMGKYENGNNRPRLIKATLHSPWNVRLALARSRTLSENPDYKKVYVNQLRTPEEMKRHRESRSIKEPSYNPNPNEQDTYFDAETRTESPKKTAQKTDPKKKPKPAVKDKQNAPQTRSTTIARLGN